MDLNASALGMVTPPTKVRVELGRIRALCDVLNDTNPAFTDPVAAHAGPWGGVVAPPTFVNCFRDFKTDLLITELGVDMPRLLHGEQEMRYYAPIRPGQVVVHQVQIVEVAEKKTRALGATDFFKVHITVRDEDGSMLVEAYQSFFVRQKGE